jgi:hypothetical protein
VERTLVCAPFVFGVGEKEGGKEGGGGAEVRMGRKRRRGLGKEGERRERGRRGGGLAGRI